MRGVITDSWIAHGLPQASESAAASLIKLLYCKCVFLELGRISSWDINQQINALRK